MVVDGTTTALGGLQRYDHICVINGGVINVTQYDGVDKTTSGNVELLAGSVYVDATSRIVARGTGYATPLCSAGAGPSTAPTAGGRGGCSVADSGGGGAHFGGGGRGTIDGPTVFPLHYEDNCGYTYNPASGGSCSSYADCGTLVTSPPCPNSSGSRLCRQGNSVAGLPFWHNIYQPEFGASGGDKGCRDGDGENSSKGGAGGGRVVIAGLSHLTSVATSPCGVSLPRGTVEIRGSIDAGGKRGCGIENDSGGGGAGGTVLIAGGQVTVTSSAVVSAAGGLGGDTRSAAVGQPDYLDCPGGQSSGTCDDCGGGGGGGIINVLSVTSDIDPLATFNVRGAAGGTCSICNGEAGGSAGELLIDGAYVGEFCDGYDNDFDGNTDEGLGDQSCGLGSCTATIPACSGGTPVACVPTVTGPSCYEAPSGVRPRISVILDTSASMLMSLDGYPTFGDGSVEHPGLDLDGNSQADDSRLYVARDALTQVMLAYPEMEFSLARYHQDQAAQRNCQTASWIECQNLMASYDDPTGNTGTAVCSVAISASTNVTVNQSPQTPEECINYAGSCGSPRRGADVLTGFGMDITDTLRWLDGRETAFRAAATPGDVCEHSSGGDCEVRGSGPTPLAGSLQAIQDYVVPIRTTDSANACREYSVILVTDGAESCNGNPATAAAALNAAGIRVYVIGVSIVASDEASLDAIAAAGGTTAAFFASSSAELSAALASIVEASIKFETCNGLDDDCDGNVDEDLPAAQPGPAAQPSALFCDGEGRRSGAQNTQVIARPEAMYAPGLLSTTPIKSTVSPNYSPDQVVCGRVEDTCSRPDSDDDCDGAIDEDGALNACGRCPGAVDVCNGIDDDCDGVYDEGATHTNVPFSACPQVCTQNVPCGTDVGECNPGVYLCVNGTLQTGACVGAYDCGTLPGATPPPGGCTEICDERDNDCDGLVDDPAVLARTCALPGSVAVGGNSICHPGTQYCAKPSVGETSDAQGYRTEADGDPFCVGQVLPEDQEICDALDHDCDGDAFTCTQSTSIHGDPYACSSPDLAFVGNACGSGVGVCVGTLACDQNGDPDGGPPELVCDAPVRTPDVTPELCNDVDDDCDGTVDEAAIAGDDLGGSPGGAVGDFCGAVATDDGVCNRGTHACINGFWSCGGAVAPSTEICDGLDNDCDGLTDNDDPDLTSITDPRLGQDCGTAVGECEPGTSYCDDDGDVVCTPMREPEIEACNGLDDDCDYLADENLPDDSPADGIQDVVPCGPDTGQCDPGRIACAPVPLVDDPDGFDLICVGGITASPEVCDNEDNDCDGDTDECAGAKDTPEYDGCNDDPLGAMGPAPTDQGLGAGGGDACPDTTVCAQGKTKCIADVDASNGDATEAGYVCVGADYGPPETCNGADDDCDGNIDEDLTDPTLGERCGDSQVPDCRDDVGGDDTPCGKCAFGTLGCQGEDGLACQNVIGPDAFELCNGTDDDCDGEVDECLTANDPTCGGSDTAGDPNVGDDCDADEPNVCGAGMLACESGNLVCRGTDYGVPELCNGEDDDCDGNIDENIPVGAACGKSQGECDPGVLVCNPDTGMLECEGGAGEIPEVCDGLDNDCDGTVDDGLSADEPCGSDEGLCEKGTLQCLNGRNTCVGETTPSLEVCDCEDNDCDGEIDETSDADPVCPGTAACFMCQCALPCSPALEFATSCPQGKAPVESGDACYCVGEQCNPRACGQETVEVDGQVRCAPSDDGVGSCVCRNNECTFRCAGVICEGGLVCDQTDGTCRFPSCLLAQFACRDAQRCTQEEGAWRCVDDACAGKSCAAGQACRDGECIGSCATVECAAGERCDDGQCAPDRCASTRCQTGEVCDPSDGECVLAGACVRSGCADGTVCDPIAGACEEDVCLSTTCPHGQRCDSATGQCALRCGGGLLYCDDSCIDPQSSRAHCGASGDCSGDGAGEICGDGLVCSRGQCSDRCADGLVNCGGDCIDPQSDQAHCGASDACQGADSGRVCRDGFACTAGECKAIAGLGGTGGSGAAGTSGAAAEAFVIASGGGGCACSVPGRALHSQDGSRRAGLGLLWVLGGLFLVARRRRWRARAAGAVLASGPWLLVALASAGAPLLSACKVEPFCLTCPTGAEVVEERDAGPSIPGADDGGYVPPLDSGPGFLPVQDGGLDGSAPRADACVDGELCNGLDDDCDGTVDEGADPAAVGIEVDTDPLHCGGCGKACALEHAFNACVDAKCTIDRSQGEQGCDVGYHDQNEDPADGCEYRCIKSRDDDSDCDLVDNDCDGEIDEDVDQDTDALNCGMCGLRCTFPHAPGGGLCVDGACVLDDSRCEAPYFNLDDEDGNGCEYKCSVPECPTDESEFECADGSCEADPRDCAELCDGRDNDCDKQADEGDLAADERVGVTCGRVLGACAPGGTAICDRGAITCDGEKAAMDEVCDGIDNDCDGLVDVDHPDLGDPCGTSVPGSECRQGTLALPSGGCSGGDVEALVCVGDQGPVDEVCNAKDDDCDGKVDEVDASSGVRPGEDQDCTVTMSGIEIITDPDDLPLGECMAGKTYCVSGGLVCRDERAPAPAELCDALDHDCDGDDLNGFVSAGVLGNGHDYASAGPDPRMGDPCGIDTGECSFGSNVCDLVSKAIVCRGGQGEVTEVCDGRDNDCDGRIDEQPVGGVLEGEDEACVTVPNGADLDGTPCTDPLGCVDDTPPASASDGECTTGTTVCSAGRIRCSGQQGPRPELCDAQDWDCDGDPVNGVAITDAEVGNPCGPPTVGVCVRGATVCVASGMDYGVVCQGAVYPTGVTPPSPVPLTPTTLPGPTGAVETAASVALCDARDNDCDGATDEGSPAGYDGDTCCDLSGFACCPGAGNSGTEQCSNGRISCVYPPTAVLPGPEVCGDGPGGFGDDDDCDGTADQGFDLDTDVNNCGTCGTVCMPQDNAVSVCDEGDCAVGACIGDFVDANDDWSDDCELACSFTGNEVCDGQDNDCNGIDDDVPADALPVQVCLQYQRGVCASVSNEQWIAYGVSCESGGVLACDLPAVAAGVGLSAFEAVETLCDGLDNDCDGTVDDGYNVGQPCDNGGVGECRETGTIECTSTSAAACNAPPLTGGTSEICDGLDNDCNGSIDDFGVPSATNVVDGFELVSLGAAHGNALMMAYEASHPDATATDPGARTQKPCSTQGVLPWASVTWTEASAACCALNANGLCQGGGAGWRLCDASTWQAGCAGSAQTCDWGYSDQAGAVCDHDPFSLAYTEVCHGAEAMLPPSAVSCAPGVSACSTVTGAAAFDDCYASWGAAGAISDLSGNLQEWTNTSPTAGNYTILGGSFAHTEPGRRCDFDFRVNTANVRLPTTGFRCCYYP